MSKDQPLQEKDIKHGMKVRTWSLEPDGFTEWEVLDRAPQPGQWWLHRWDENGEWQTTCCHRYNFSAVEEQQPALV